MRFGVWGMGYGVWGLGFGVWGLGFGVWGLGFGVWGLGFGVYSLGFRVSSTTGPLCMRPHTPRNTPVQQGQREALHATSTPHQPKSPFTP